MPGRRRRSAGAMLATALLLSAVLTQAPPPPAVLTDDGTLLLGTPGKPASQLELFEALGRDELAAQARGRLVRKVALLSTGAAVGAAAVAVGVTLLVSSRPEQTVGRCDPYLPLGGCVIDGPCPGCVAGAVTLAAGAVVAGTLLSLGLATRLDVLSPPELRRLLGQPPPALSLRLTPWVGPGGGGLLARLEL